MKETTTILGMLMLAGVLHLTAAVIPPSSEPSVALVSKVILDVTRKEVGKDWQTAKRGEILSTGDKVKTGNKSLAIVKFKDNSLVRVREQSELTVTGDLRGSTFSKSVKVDDGAVGFNIRKQKPDEEFRFTSPTSVASIRGTGGMFTSRNAQDTLTVVEGAVVLTNNKSSASVEVKAGFTGISSPDGTIETRPATPEELTAAQNAAQVSDRENKLEIDLRDKRGNQKQLKIDIK